MAQIMIKDPEGSYNCTINTGAMDIDIRNLNIGMRMITEDNELLSASMRDGGFELQYTEAFGVQSSTIRVVNGKTFVSSTTGEIFVNGKRVQ